MKITKCKRCDQDNVIWYQGRHGRWELVDAITLQKHFCEDEKLKAVKCKYCNADDLHWAEEIDPFSKRKKAVLTESYGLPHACEQRIALLAKEKQEKLDKYEAEKKRILSLPDGVCTTCKGAGYLTSHSPCQTCRSMGHINERVKKKLIYLVRKNIWPHVKHVADWRF